MWYIVRLDSSRVATLLKVRSGTLVSSGDPTRVKSNYIPVYTTMLRQIERCPGDKWSLGARFPAVTASQAGSCAPHNVHDPMVRAYLRPSAWEWLFSRVNVLKHDAEREQSRVSVYTVVWTSWTSRSFGWCWSPGSWLECPTWYS